MIIQVKNRCKRGGFFLTIAAIVFLLGRTFASEPDWCRHLPRPTYAKLEKIDVGSEWFEVHRIQPNLYAISEPRQFEEVISYLMIGSERALLWDTGMGIVDIKPIVSKLTDLPIVVLNSHTHPDHIGGNHEFEHVWALKTDFTETNSKGYTDPEMKDWVGPENICGKLPAGFEPSKYAIQPYRISRFITDQEVIDLGGRQVQVLHTPGHTPDTLCLIDRKNRLLFTGDTFYIGAIYLYAPETNFDDYVRSVERLMALTKDVDMLMMAHNDPVGPPSLLNALKSAVEQIRSGEMKPMDKQDLHEYFFQSFSILVRKP
jgi:glyoxylase-like metal-dependent hydrolase (beta-lactamase superfamily II)